MQPSIGILLRELTRLYSQAQREHVTSGHDTSSTQNHVLMELGRAELLTQHELGRRLSLDKGWVSRAVESLVQAGLVAKSRQDNDRRNRWLQLTVSGKTHYQALNEALDSHAEQLMQPLSAEQRSVVHQGLLLLLNSLQGSVDDLPAEDLAIDAVIAAPSPGTEAVVTATQTVGAALAPVDGEEPELVLADGSAESVETAAQQHLAQAPADVIAPPAAEPTQDTETAAPPANGAITAAADTATSTGARSGAEPVAPQVKAETPRPVHSASASRILGSRSTLPTRPLLSRTPPRTPLSRAAQSAEQKAEDEAIQQRPHGSNDMAHQVPPRQPHASPAMPPRTQASSASRPFGAGVSHTPPAAAPQRVTPVRPAAAPVTPAMQAPHQPSGSLFQKILSQGSLFNKLLQRDTPAEEPEVEAPPPVEVEPEDGLLFQPASQTDWNEIRNLLTANRLQVQGALNHLSNFVVATENGRVVGAIGMEVYGDIGLIRSLVVASNMRGRKVARRLIKQLISRARTRQVGALYLLSGPADDLFYAFGFEKMARADMPTKLYVSSEMQGPSSASPTGMRLIL